MSDKTLRLEATIGDRQKTYSYNYEWNCPVPEGLTPIHEGLLQKGFGETLRDAFSTLKSVKGADDLDYDATPSDKDAVTHERLARLIDGTYIFGGGGGGGAKQSPTTKGWIAYFNSKATKVKIQRNNKRVPCNGTNLEEFRDFLTKHAIQPSITKHLATMEEPAQRDWIKTKLADAIAIHKPKVIETYEADQTVGEGVGWYIKQEKIKLEGGSTESDLIHIEATFDNI
jgi:hypothetical protein